MDARAVEVPLVAVDAQYDRAVGFRREAKKVRDLGLSRGARVIALCHCVERYSPIGFEATLAFLGAKAGPYRSSDEALVRAIEMLESARDLRTAEAASYAERRRREKHLGQRSPTPSSAAPNLGVQWHGMEREAADHPKPDQGIERDLWDLAEVVERTDGLNDDERNVLENRTSWLDAQLRESDYFADPADYFLNRRLLWVAGQLRFAAGA